ncbi:AEC family transporter [Ferrovibrio sp.]|uniref:AEC family transporter n=1 Tax=Ferrovibrio sp. TaxID=1917215 RepID=UPI0025C66561|nr:AEC family transporter [Ferrovibrio sp.]
MMAEIFAVIAPIFVLAGLGFIWAKRRLPFPTDSIGLLATNIGTPCLVIATLIKADISRDDLGLMALATLLALSSFLLLGAAALYLLKLPMRSFLPSLGFPNTGNAGLSLCLFAFGAPGLALGLVFFAITSFGNFAVGQSIYAGRGNWREVARSPVVYAVPLAALGNIFQVELPLFLMRSLETAGSIAIPLMMLTLGVSLANLRVTELRVALLLTALRLGFGLAVGVALAWAFGLTGVARGVLIIQCAMPVAVMNAIFAARYNRDPAAVAGLVVVSTLISFATLPLLLLLALE